eukprot:TRINITY_DN6242_c0_g1_i4.p1 TRINITY_DN6242_c0_g1~~TRINITY_DN6242_c0_g1_i4.p1  ORF type:complete len:442 (+),score=110.03 TRINITY_DN6242_c0_g1_i4:79-1404(+)
MRGGPSRLLMSPFITGSLGFLLLIVGLSYWSATTQNRYLTQKLEELQRDVRLEAKLVEDTEARCAKYELHITEEKDKLQEEVNDCRKKFDLLEKENIHQVGVIQDLEERNGKLQTQIDQLSMDSVEENRLQDQNQALQDTIDQLQTKIGDIESQLIAEKVKSEDLQGKISISNSNEQSHTGGLKHSLGPGQLPDVNPAAVNVIKKETFGSGNSIKIEPVNKAPSLTFISNIPPPSNSEGVDRIKAAMVSPLLPGGQQVNVPELQAGFIGLKRGISSTSAIPKQINKDSINNEASIQHSEENTVIKEKVGVIAENEENVEKIIEANFLSNQKLNQDNKEEAPVLSKEGVDEKIKKEDKSKESDNLQIHPEQLLDSVNHENESQLKSGEEGEAIDNENVEKIMAAQAADDISNNKNADTNVKKPVLSNEEPAHKVDVYEDSST